ncbi:MAG: PH domain-containing protein [Candidatus Saccharimonadales bacterium]
MDSKSDTQTDYDKPVAYDKDGNPLYAHPPKASDKHEKDHTQVVHMTRSTDPEKMVISPTTQLKHDRSTKAYPTLNLSAGEYIVRDIRRHPIGLIPPFAVGAFIISLALILLFNYEAIFKSIQVPTENLDSAWVTLPIMGFILLVVIGMYVAYYVYENNRFYLTNESVIQEIQNSLLFKSEQTVSLLNIEDASFAQEGILQQLFNYGSIRLSTEGEETTYRMTYVPKPKEAIIRLNNAVEAFKNGRPIEDD